MCTAVSFTDSKNNLYFGRNLDVPQTYGEKVIVTPRGYDFNFKHEGSVKLSKAIIGMGIEAGGYPLYFDAANENGLCIANLNFPIFTTYSEELKEGATNITSYEYMVWVLENFDTVAEVKEAMKNFNFINTPLNEHMTCQPAHWIISDATASIVVEPAPRGIMVYDNPVGVLTNNPEFDWHLMNLNNYSGLKALSVDHAKWGDLDIRPLGVGSGAFGLPGDFTPQSRFVKVAFVNAQFVEQKTEEANAARLLQTLKVVSMPEGSVDGEITIYSSCYSPTAKTYYYQTNDKLDTFRVEMTEELMTSDTLTIV